MAHSKDKKTKIPKPKYKDEYLPKTEEEWVRYVNDCHYNGMQARRKYEFQWTLNFAYYKGYQHLIYNERTGNIEIPKTMIQPLTINRIASFVDSRLAKLTKNRPAPKVVPNTNDKEDVNGAKYSGHALMHLWRKIDMEEEYEALVMMCLINGTSFMRSLWNPHCGDKISREVYGKEDELVIGNDMKPKEETIWLGEVESKGISAFNLIPANDCIPTIKEQPYIIERSWKPVTEVYKYYPHLRGKLKLSSTNEVTGDRSEYEKIVARLSTPIAASVKQGSSKAKDNLNSEVLCKTMWIRPNDDYENGLVVVVIQDQLALIDEFPNDYGDNIYPFAMFKERTDGQHFWGQSVIERLMSIQKAYNRLRQKKLRSSYLMANPKWWVAKGSQLQEDALTDEEGEIVETNPAVPKPEQLAIAPMPNYVVELARELIIDFRDVGGQRESSVTPPPGVTAAVAIEVLSEVSDEIIGPILKRLARCMTKVANTHLLLMNEEYIEPRKILIMGEGDAMGYMWMQNTDFKHHTDVHIEIESLFPDFRGAKQQRLVDLWDRRIITDPVQFLKAYRFGDVDSLLEAVEKKEDLVALEIKQIKDGAQPEVTPYQDHATHFRKLSEWINTPEFLRLPLDRKQLALGILQQHMQFLLQSLPNQGEPVEQTNQAAVNTPYGSQRPQGA